MNTPQNLLAHLRNAETNHIGFSYNINNGDSNPETGYMVSRKGYEQTAPQGCDLVAYGRNYFLLHAEQLADPTAYMGCWYNAGQFVFDISDNIAMMDNAIELGMRNNQEAIWDCASGSEYRLMREGDVEAYNENAMEGMIEAMYEAIDEFEGMYNHCAGENKDHYETRITQLNNVLNLLNSLK